MAAMVLSTSLVKAEEMHLVVIDKSVSATVPASGVLLPLHCDSDENLFLRAFNGNGSVRPGAEPVVKIDKHALLKATFSLTASPELAGLVSGDYFPASDGELYELAWVPGKWPIYLVTFDKAGDYKSKLELGQNISPSQLVVFPKGEFMVSGTEPETHDAKGPKKPLTVLFDHNGKFLKNIAFEDDEHIAKAGAAGDTDYVASVNGPNRAITMGDVTIGADGNAYLMRRMNPTVIYVISPAGEVVQRLRIDPGNPEMTPHAIHAAKGRLVLMYSVAGTVKLIVVDPGTGDVLARYDSAPDLGATFACSSEKDFVFLGNDQNTGKMTVTVAGPR
jgi:hypothetical protein